MWTRDDLIDVLMARLAHLAEPAPGSRPAKKGRVFLSEYEIKRMLTPLSQHLTIPKEAILSPLAVDWLTLKGIKVVRE